MWRGDLGMDVQPSFADKLNLVLRALTMSRGRLASELGVDKSVVSRWTSGATDPSAHNLANLTALIAARIAGFTLLDWERDIASLAELLGVDPALAPAPIRRRSPPPSVDEAPQDLGVLDLPFGAMQLAMTDMHRKSHSYEGHYTSVRPSVLKPGMVLRDHIIMRREGGRMMMRTVGAGRENAGWVVSAQDQLYCVLGDDGDDSLAFMLLNGTPAPRALVLDGIYMSVTLDQGRSIVALPTVLTRISDLSEDPAVDDAIVAEAKKKPLIVDAAELEPRMREHLFREVGPGRHAEGGELLMRIPWEESMATGSLALGAFNVLVR